jgi:hypothetical protein
MTEKRSDIMASGNIESRGKRIEFSPYRGLDKEPRHFDIARL